MIYASTKKNLNGNKKSSVLGKNGGKNGKSVVPSFNLPPIVDHITSKPILGDAIGRKIVRIENSIDKLYTSSNIPPDVKTVAINKVT